MSSAQNPELLSAASAARERAATRSKTLAKLIATLQERLAKSRDQEHELSAMRVALMQKCVESLGEVPFEHDQRAKHLRGLGEITAAFVGCAQDSVQAQTIQQALAAIARVNPGDRIRLKNGEHGEERFGQVVGMAVFAPPAGPRLHVLYRASEHDQGPVLSQGARVQDLAIKTPGGIYVPATPFEVYSAETGETIIPAPEFELKAPDSPDYQNS